MNSKSEYHFAPRNGEHNHSKYIEYLKQHYASPAKQRPPVTHHDDLLAYPAFCAPPQRVANEMPTVKHRVMIFLPRQ